MAGLRTIGRPFDAELHIYNGNKYTEKGLMYVKKIIKNVETWEVLEPGDEEREQYEASVDDTNLIDDFHEYLVLNLVGGEQKIFRNSYVDMFH